jgi:two-component system nitrate/nitrite response regulator NarL
MKNIINIFVASGNDEDCERILNTLSDQNDFRIAGVEKDEAGTIIKSAQLKPDVLIIDLQPPGMGGEVLAPIIHRRSPSTAIIMLCDKEEDNYVCVALKAGISGFLLKNVDTDKLAPVVKIVYSGGYYISAPIITRIFSDLTLKKKLPELPNNNFGRFYTTTERIIITDIARGFSDEEIANHMNYNIGTIRNCLTDIRRKTKLKNRVHIVIFSLIHGLINIDHFDPLLIRPPEINDDLDNENKPRKKRKTYLEI